MDLYQSMKGRSWEHLDTALKNKPAEMPVLFVFTVFEEAAPHDGAVAVFLTDGIKGLI